MKYFIIYRGIFGPDGKQIDGTDSFNSHDCLDGWSEVRFSTEEEARAFVAKNKGPDSAGYTARFSIVKAED